MPETKLLIAKQKKTVNIRIVLWTVKEGSKPLLNFSKFPSRAHCRVLAKLDWNKKEQVVSVFTDMALPKIEQVHVVDCCLAPLYFKQNACVSYRAKIVRPKSFCMITLKEPPSLISKPKFTRKPKKRFMYKRTIHAWLVCLVNQCLYFR